MKKSGKFLGRAADAYNNKKLKPMKKYQLIGEVSPMEQASQLSNLATKKKVQKNTTPSDQELEKMKAKAMKNYREPSFMDQVRGIGKNIKKSINRYKYQTRGGGFSGGGRSGGYVPQIKGACGPGGCLKPGKKMGGSVKKKK